MARLTLPLDATGIEGRDPRQPVKALLTAGGKPLASQVIEFDPKGMAYAQFEFKEAPGALRVIVGPPDAADDELVGLQTLGIDVPLRRFFGRDELALPPLRIPEYHWFWWLRWCRTFTVRGRLLCPDGSPVPGAVVCAYDVDAFWWWWSKQQLACDTTDANGSFSLSFRWCCGWWPWWWWSLRRWQVEPDLGRQIFGALQREPRLPKIPLPDPAPDFNLFQRLLGQPELLTGARAAPGGRLAKPLQQGLRGAPNALLAPPIPRAPIQPERLDGLREQLVAKLPPLADRLTERLWPWAPWQPWWDCTPDLVFRATQRCGGVERVIVDEGWLQARWNVPQLLDVTLTASDDACCVPVNDCEEGECLALAKVCSVDADQVGGNPGAAATPVGYAHPNEIANNGDAPFAGVVNIRGTAQCISGIDYYGIEFSDDDGATWADVPVEALGSFVREYWDFALGTDVDVGFSATVPISGQHVYETVAHYEQTHTPGDWGGSKVWLGTNIDLVFPWVTAPAFGDGTYLLRVIGYSEAGGVLAKTHDPLLVCDSQTPAQIVVTIDNQSVFDPPGPGDNLCGPGTTHSCTNEPMTDILDARIVHIDNSASPIGPCGNVTLAEGDMLEVDFIAFDAQGHLASYSLIATYGENLARDLIALAGGAAGLHALPGGAPPVPAAAQVGPDYATARSVPQNAAAPTWAGGALRLRLPAATAFPESCCYQLELRAYKRTIVNCQETFAHRNLSERSFQVTV
jgi:hypothetical protein